MSTTLKEFIIDISVRAAKAVNELMGVDKAAAKAEGGLNDVGRAADITRGKLIALSRGIQAASQSHIDAGQRMAATGAKLTLGLTTPLILFAKSASRAASEADTAFALVQQRIQTMGTAAGYTADQLAAMAGSLMGKSLYDDDAIMKDLTANLLTYGQVQGKVFADAQQAIVDLAAAKGQDLQTTTDAVGKALSSAKGAAALSRTGTLLPADIERVKLLFQQGKQLEAQQYIIEAINKQYGGSAEVLRKKNPAAAAALDAAQAMEKVGKAVNRMIVKLAPTIERFADWISSLSDAQLDLAVKIGIGMAVIGPLMSILGGLRVAFGLVIGPIGRVLGFFTRFSDAGRLGIAIGFKIKRAFMPLINLFKLFSSGLRLLAFTPWGRAISLLILAGTLIYQNWDQIAPIFAELGAFMSEMWASVQPLITELVAAFEGLWQAIKSAIAPLGPLFMDLWQGPVGTAIKGLAMLVGALLVGSFKIAVLMITAAVRAIVAAVTAMVNIISGIINFWVAVFKGDWAGAWQAVKGIFSAAWNGILGVLNGIIPGITGKFAAVYNAAKTYLVDKIGAVFQWFSTKLSQLTSGNIGDFTGLWNSGAGGSGIAPLPTPSNSPAPSKLDGGRYRTSMNNSGNVTVNVQGGSTPGATGRAVAGAVKGTRGQMLGAVA